MPGPVPKRSGARRRRNKDDVEVMTVDLSESLAETVEIPAPPVLLEDEVDEETGEIIREAGESLWDPIAERWYLSLTKSGQAIFYEPSDWMTAYMMADQFSRQLAPRPTAIGVDANDDPIIRYLVPLMSGGFLSSWLKASSSLMTTEGERRRLKIELDRQKIREAKADGNVVSIASSRAAALGGKQ